MSKQATRDQMIDAVSVAIADGPWDKNALAHRAVRAVLRLVRPLSVAKVAERLRDHVLGGMWDGRWNCQCGEVFPDRYVASEHVAAEILK